MMPETTAEYHRRRAAEETAEAVRHPDDITAAQHRRLAKEHLTLAREAEKSASADGNTDKKDSSREHEAEP